MGAAKRKKDLGTMPEQSSKPLKRARRKVDPRDGVLGMGGTMMLLSSLLYGSNSGRNFAMRSELARMNRELDRPSGHQSTESA